MPVLAFSLCDEGVYASRVRQAGAWAFVSKDAESHVVLDTIRQLLEGGQSLPTSPKQDSAEGFRQQLAKLTDRELEVFEMFGHGLTVQQVATRLDVSQNTILSYRERIKKKLDFGSSNELTVRAAQWVHET